jgi:hypothetical protein
MNPGSIGWAYIDFQGNLKAKGTITLQTGLPTGKQDAQILGACLQLAVYSNTNKKPEKLLPYCTTSSIQN